MSQNLQDLLDSLSFVRAARKQFHPHNDSFQWNKLWNIDRYLDKQLRDYFEHEAAA